MRFLPLVKALSVSAALASMTVLSGCATTASLLSDGTPSGMDNTNTRLRSSLAIVPSSLPQQLAYVPTQACTYRETVTPVGQPPQVRSYSVTLKPVRRRLLLSFVGPGETSTALIDRNGKLFDFNSLDRSDGSRWTSDNYRIRSAQQAAQERSKYGSSAHSINELTALYPRFMAGRQQTGEAVANVSDEAGNLWASYLYRGKTQYGGTQAVVLDLMRRLETRPGNPTVVIGFNVLDASTMAPLLFVLDSGYKLRIERVSCP